ncbi:hypothetical protein V2I01_26135 [Micromonospora sp. BRA006-A]|nr:hypothetical protein [Micromonospora sp. BRA006-A]
MRSPSSAGVSTAYRWRWNWPRPAWPFSTRASWRHGSTTASGCCHPAGAPRPASAGLRAVIDWSWELLSPPERAVLRRLAVFADGATLAAAEQVCGGGQVASDEILDVLARLIDRSLVMVRHGEGQRRLRLPETVAAYGLEQLDRAAELPRLVAVTPRVSPVSPSRPPDGYVVTIRVARYASSTPRTQTSGGTRRRRHRRSGPRGLGARHLVVLVPPAPGSVRR